MTIRREGHITIETLKVPVSPGNVADVDGTGTKTIENRLEHLSPPLLAFHARKLGKQPGDHIPSNSAAKRYMRSLQPKQARAGKRRTG